MAGKATKRRPCDSRGAVAGLQLTSLPHTTRRPCDSQGGHRQIPASAILDYKYRREAAHAAMREAMQAGEQLADEN
jgi:hypothetical protein